MYTIALNCLLLAATTFSLYRGLAYKKFKIMLMLKVNQGLKIEIDKETSNFCNTYANTCNAYKCIVWLHLK